MRSAKSVLTLLIFQLSCTSVQGLALQEGDPLGDVVKRGVNHAFPLQTERLTLETSRAQRNINYSALLPIVNLGMTKGYANDTNPNNPATATGSMGLSATWTIWDGYASITNVRVGERQYAQEKVNAFRQVQQYVVTLIGAYLDYQLLLSSREILQARLQQSRATDDESQALVSVGSRTSLEAMDTEIEVANTERDLMELENSITSAERNLRVLINDEDLKNLPRLDLLTDTPYYMAKFFKRLPLLQQTWQQEIEASNPDLKFSKIDLEISSLGLTQTKLSYLPSTSITLAQTYPMDRYMQDAQNGTKVGYANNSITFNLTWKVWDWWATPYTIANAKRGHEAKLLTYHESDLRLHAQMENLLRQISVLEKTIETSKLVVKKAQKQLEYSREVYKLGRITLLAMQQSTARVFDAQIALASRLRDREVISAQILYAVGEDLTPPGYDLSWTH